MCATMLIDGLIVHNNSTYNPLIPIVLALTKILSQLFGSHHRPQFIQKIGFDAFNKNFDQKLMNSQFVTTNRLSFIILLLPLIDLNVYFN